MTTLKEDLFNESWNGKAYISDSLAPNQFYMVTKVKRNKVIGAVYNLKTREYQFSAPFKIPRHLEDRRAVSISESELDDARESFERKQKFRAHWDPIKDLEEFRSHSLRRFRLARAKGY